MTQTDNALREKFLAWCNKARIFGHGSGEAGGGGGGTGGGNTPLNMTAQQCYVAIYETAIANPEQWHELADEILKASVKTNTATGAEIMGGPTNPPGEKVHTAGGGRTGTGEPQQTHGAGGGHTKGGG